MNTIYYLKAWNADDRNDENEYWFFSNGEILECREANLRKREFEQKYMVESIPFVGGISSSLIQPLYQKEAENLPEYKTFDDMHPSGQCIYNVLKAFFDCDDVDCLCQSDFKEDPLKITMVVEQVKHFMDNK